MAFGLQRRFAEISLTIWSRILGWRGAVVSAGAEDAALRESFMKEGRAHNLRMLPRVLPVALVLHSVSVITFSRTVATTPAESAWLGGLVRIHLTLAAIALFAFVVAVRGWLPGLRDRLGDAVGVAYILGTAAISSNAQRFHPNLNSFTFGAFGVAFVVHLAPKLYVPAVLSGGALIAWFVNRFGQGQGRANADQTSLLVVLLVSVAAFFASRNLRFREHRARLQVERLNAELEERVASQVHEIVARAQEVSELNTQLNHKVRERSRELTMALARLAADHESLPSGTVLGDRVEIERPIGKGGMGAVYRARDLATGKTVAVKVVQAGSANELDDLYRFLREAQALASLTHPAIVRSVHVDVADDGRLFQMMELVHGESLQSHIDREERLSSFHAARLGAVLAAGLAAAHAAGIIHRDVKPANVMLTPAAPGLKLLDFGISKLRDARHQAGATQGAVIGTLEFLSPEQVESPAEVTDRADVYQLGLVLYLCLAGRLPYDLSSARSWLVAHTLHPAVDLVSVAPDVDPEVARLVMTCLAKTPGDRPAAAAVAKALGAVADVAGVPPLEDLGLCARAESAPAPSSSPIPEAPSTGIRRTTQPWRRTMKARR